MEDAAQGQGLPEIRPSQHAGGWRVLWFFPHLAVVYAITNFGTAWLSGWTRGTLLPFLQQPTALSSFEFLFTHILAFSLVPAFAAGLVNARFKHRAAQFVWLVPGAILAYKFLTFPAPSVFHSQFSAAFHWYFAGGFVVPEFRNWHDFWTLVGSNSDMTRGKAQLDFTAPFYAGVGYSVAAWIGLRTNLSERVSDKVKEWEDSRFEHRPHEDEGPDV
jgi:hypothetical protein